MNCLVTSHLFSFNGFIDPVRHSHALHPSHDGTGELWDNFIYDAAAKLPGCVVDPSYDPAYCGFNDAPGCIPLNGCGEEGVIPFLVVFTMIITFVCLNLFVGVVLAEYQNFTSSTVTSYCPESLLAAGHLLYAAPYCPVLSVAHGCPVTSYKLLSPVQPRKRMPPCRYLGCFCIHFFTPPSLKLTRGAAPYNFCQVSISVANDENRRSHATGSVRRVVVQILR